MKKIISKIKKVVSESDKASLTVYIVLRILVIICMVRELYNGNIENALLCVFALILFLLPVIAERTFKIDLPVSLEITILLFIFSAEILGEINNFYGKITIFDDILHTLNGFLAASIDFSLVYLLNKNITAFKLSPFFVSLVAFCFSMTIGIMWEFLEYGMDNILSFDTQKDAYVYKINTVELDPLFDNNVIKVKNIDHTIVYDANGNEITRINGYLDIGLHDTMKDLMVNFIGAIVFCIFGYLYMINQEKYKAVGNLLTKRNDWKAEE